MCLVGKGHSQPRCTYFLGSHFRPLGWQLISVSLGSKAPTPSQIPARAVRFLFPCHPSPSFSLALPFYEMLFATTRYSLLLSKKSHLWLKGRNYSFLGGTYRSGTYDQGKWVGGRGLDIKLFIRDDDITSTTAHLQSSVPSPSPSGTRCDDFISMLDMSLSLVRSSHCFECQ